MQTPLYPAGRYGRRRDPVRRGRVRAVSVVVTALIVAGGGLLAVKLYRQYVQPPFAVDNVVVGTPADTSITVSFDVRRPGGPASCTVVALAHDASRLATVDIAVPAPPAGQTDTHVNYTIQTPTRPFTASVQGCGPRT
jgi:hypothetical protein